MNQLLANAGKAFIKAFVASLVVVAVGITSQPSLSGTGLVAVTGIMGAVAAGLAAVQTFIPELTFAPYIPAPYGSMLDSFVRAALGAFTVAWIGILQHPATSANGWQAAAIGAAVGALNAGLQALQGTLTAEMKPILGFGIQLPSSATGATQPKSLFAPKPGRGATPS